MEVVLPRNASAPPLVTKLLFLPWIFARAEAGYEETHQVYTRLLAVDKAQPNLIAQQELDAAVEKDRATASALAGAKAEVDLLRAEIAKLQTMLKYSRIVAPFSGVITRR
jgi:multidrug resistance efflux pump